MTPEVMAVFSQFGFPGLLIGYLIWRESQQAKTASEIERARLEESRLKSDAEKSLATALSALTVMIQNLAERLK